MCLFLIMQPHWDRTPLCRLLAFQFIKVSPALSICHTVGTHQICDKENTKLAYDHTFKNGRAEQIFLLFCRFEISCHLSPHYVTQVRMAKYFFLLSFRLISREPHTIQLMLLLKMLSKLAFKQFLEHIRKS